MHNFRLYIESAVYCASNFYGPQCDVYCLASDSCDGHFTCDPVDGSRDCLPGWTGDDCTEPIDENTNGVCVMNVPLAQCK